MFPPITTLFPHIKFVSFIDLPEYVPPQKAEVETKKPFSFPIPQINTQNFNNYAIQQKPVQREQPKLKSKFTSEEDQNLRMLVYRYGTKDWQTISKLMGTRNPRQCRERWNNYLKPELTQMPWSMEEDILLANKFAEYGSHWSKISKFFPNRSDNNIRNRWQFLLRQSERRSNFSSMSSAQVSD